MRRLSLTCALMAATALSAGAARAQPLTIEDLASGAAAVDVVLDEALIPMSEAELADERGGFLTPLGEINFAATLTTIVNGQTALKTTFTLTEQGLQQQVASHLSSAIANAVRANPATGGSSASTQAVAPAVSDRDIALNAAAGALTPAVTALDQATDALTSGLDAGNPASNQPSLQEAGGVSEVATALPAGDTQQALGGLPGAIDKLVDAVTAYVPVTQEAQSQVTGQAAVFTPDVLPQTSGELQAAAAAAGINLGGLEGNGLVIPGDGGATAVLHNLASNALTNTVINTANNVDVRLHTQLDVVMPGLSNLQDALAETALTSSLHESIGRALAGF